MTRVLIENSGYALDNMGDVAMLQVAYRRVVQTLPNARVQVLTFAPDRLERVCPGAEPLDGHALGRLMEARLLPDFCFRLGLAKRRLASRASYWAQARFPALHHRRALARLREDAPVRELLAAVDGCDLLLLAGGGYITDVFPHNTSQAFRLIHRAQQRAAPVVMVGQGIGPIESRTLRYHARRLLPGVAAIRLREAVRSVPTLQSLGVPPDRWRVTGDDAIELAAQPLDPQEPAEPPNALGLNLRDSSYTRVDEQERQRLREGIDRVSRQHSLWPLPLPVALNAEYHDLASVQRVIRFDQAALDLARGVDMPIDLVRLVARCRLVITGSYHAGVFALCRGVPVIGLSKSAYYDAKFDGLIGQFGPACRVVRLDEADLSSRLQATADELIASAPSLRAGLSERVASQVQSSRQVWDELPAILKTK